MEFDAPYANVKQKMGKLVEVCTTDRRSFRARCCDGSSPNAVRRRVAPALERRSVDKLRHRFALFEDFGNHYTLTFTDAVLPQNRTEARRAWRAFTTALRRWRKRKGLPTDFRYIYSLEHKHGEGRWHFHVFLDRRDFPEDVIRQIWDNGHVDVEVWDKKSILSAKPDGYHRLALYFSKENEKDVGFHVWGCSRSLARAMPLPTVTFTKTGEVRLPPGAIRLPEIPSPRNGEFGFFQHVRYLEK